MSEEELRRELEELKNENKALKYRSTEKETYIVSDLDNCWQKAIRLTEEQAKAIEWFIDKTDVDYYIQKASEVNEEIE